MAGAERRRGPLQGETPQAEEFAKWLSDVTRALTLRKLQERFPYGRTQWGQFRSGEKLIPLWLLEDVVRALVPEPRRREHLLEKGRRLLRDAEDAAVGKLVTIPQPTGQQTVGELQLRLDDARRGQMKAERALFEVGGLVMMLLNMVASLQQRCQTLEATQQPAAPADNDDGIRKELEETRLRLGEAEAQLDRARREREEAEDLRVGAHLQAARRQRELHLLAGDDAAADEEPKGVHAVEVPGLPPLYEYDTALERSAAQLDATGQGLTALRDELGLARGTQEPTADAEIVRGQVADNGDLPVHKGGWRASSTAPDGRSVSMPDLLKADTAGATGRQVVGHQEPKDDLAAVSRPAVGGQHLPDDSVGSPLVGEDYDGEWVDPLESDRQWRHACDAARDDLRQGMAIANGVLTRFKTVLGPDHEIVLRIRGTLAGWLGLSGYAAGAVTAYAELLADRLRIQGPDHRSIIGARTDVADWLSQAGDETGAAAAYAEVLADSRRILGPDHESTFRARFKVAYARDRLGDTTGATQELDKIVADQARVLGPDHLHVLGTRETIAARRGRRGDAVGAAQAFADLLADCQRLLGPDHTHTRFIRHQYQYWRGQIGLWQRLQLRLAVPPTR
ncbi:hypothetical protein Sros01_67870 [Streptomyces roseochromogenus]|nr:hypothetical protein Sros01_67870 [Streptomyces roseochromogenus]